MRPSLLLALVATTLPTTAAADSFAEIAGGFMVPLEDGDWTDLVESGPKLALRVGAMGPTLGGIVSIDWSPINTDADGELGGLLDVSAQRFRIVAGVGTQRRVAAKLTASVRLGAGIDIAHVNVDAGFLGERTDTDSGLALEAAGGLWFDAGAVQIGGELALPMSFHADDADDELDLADYSSLDIDVLFGVRLLSR